MTARCVSRNSTASWSAAPRRSCSLGRDEVLVPAHALLGKPGIRLVSGNRVNFHHLLLGEHEVIDCAGMATESLLPTEYGLAQLSEVSQAQVREILKTRPAYLPARPILRAYEATLLAA